MFVDGEDYEAVFETQAGSLWVSATVSIVGTTIALNELILYPTTSSTLQVSVAELFTMLRTLEEDARSEGYTKLIITAHRVYGRKPGRSIFIVRSLHETSRAAIDTCRDNVGIAGVSDGGRKRSGND